MDIELPRGEGPRAPLQPPRDAGYLLVAAQVERRAPFLPSGRRKRALIDSMSRQLADLARVNTVTYADLFVARLVAPGEGDELLRRRAIRPARFDLVVLVQTVDPASALDLRDNPSYKQLRSESGDSSTRCVRGCRPKRSPHRRRRAPAVVGIPLQLLLRRRSTTTHPRLGIHCRLVCRAHDAAGLGGDGASGRRAHGVRDNQPCQLATLANVLATADPAAVVPSLRSRHIRRE